MWRFDLLVFQSLWGNNAFEYYFRLYRGLSGVILCIWNRATFISNKCFCRDNYIVIDRVWVLAHTNCL